MTRIMSKSSSFMDKYARRPNAGAQLFVVTLLQTSVTASNHCYESVELTHIPIVNG